MVVHQLGGLKQPVPHLAFDLNPPVWPPNLPLLLVQARRVQVLPSARGCTCVVALYPPVVGAAWGGESCLSTPRGQQPGNVGHPSPHRKAPQPQTHQALHLASANGVVLILVHRGRWSVVRLDKTKPRVGEWALCRGRSLLRSMACLMWLRRQPCLVVFVTCRAATRCSRCLARRRSCHAVRTLPPGGQLVLRGTMSRLLRLAATRSYARRPGLPTTFGGSYGSLHAWNARILPCWRASA